MRGANDHRLGILVGSLVYEVSLFDLSRNLSDPIPIATYKHPAIFKTFLRWSFSSSWYLTPHLAYHDYVVSP